MRVAILIATYGDEKWNELALERAIPSALAEYERSAACVGVGHIHSPEKLPTAAAEPATLASTRNFAAASFMVPGETGRIRIESLHHPEEGREFDIVDGLGADWLCFLDADDELEPGYIDAMAEAHRQMDYRVFVRSPLLVPSVRFIQPNDPPEGGTRRLAVIPNKGRWPRLNECVIGTLVNRRLFDVVGGFREKTDNGEPMPMYEDWDLWLRCWDSGAQLVYVQEAVYRAHVNHEGRNVNTNLAAQVYDAIWQDHVADRAVLGRLPS